MYRLFFSWPWIDVFHIFLFFLPNFFFFSFILQQIHKKNQSNAKKRNVKKAYQRQNHSENFERKKFQRNQLIIDQNTYTRIHKQRSFFINERIFWSKLNEEKESRRKNIFIKKKKKIKTILEHTHTTISIRCWQFL